ncbi:MAG TPA: AAA family ATPase [Cyclobacteriaceae bacterium]|nr:AAA family ATPase [Cyclobacteriaceae bacterium]HMX88064.1 AAA family ATPase [Saprospiraceae bacterium]HMX00897.1 AAA family ATPase [Cyclobacteriaceae bacterium]HMY93701.1 AAA family ATPase [Cyclobacteriaceae bacterium]HNA12865.1 AAA family ATPase [Cyclobacteriaceae bacterium]
MSKADLYLEYWNTKMPAVIAGLQANIPIDITDIVSKASDRKYGVSFKIANQKFYAVGNDEEKAKAPRTYVRYFFDVFKNTDYFKEHLADKTLLVKISHRDTNEQKPITLTIQVDKDIEPIGNTSKGVDHYIELYKKLISNQLPELSYNEIYKWETIQHFQDNWTDAHDAVTIAEVLKRSFNKENNNLWSGQNFFPFAMLLGFAERDGATVSAMFKKLYDENIPLAERFEFFYAKSEELLKVRFPQGDKVHYQSDRVLILYLTLRYPEKYYLYKSKMFKTFCELTGFWDFPKVKKRDTLTKVMSYTEMCEALRPTLETDNELMALHKKRLPAEITFNDNNHLLTQDFIYSVTTYLSEQEEAEDPHEEDTIVTSPNMALNQIFFGPPGTGKTYHTVNEAVRITDPEFFKANEHNRDKLKERFRELLIKDWDNTKGQIAFCTFHQSFGYEDFVEGIKPVKPIEGDNYLKYIVEDGIFKRICRLSEDSRKSKQLKTERLISWDEETFRKAAFYKISLGDANIPEDQEIFDYCIKNNCIALGYGGMNDFTGLDEDGIVKKCKEAGLKDFAAQALNYFIHYLKRDNYVLISYGNHYVRALARVTGEYYYNTDAGIRYNHFRKVEWLITDQTIPIDNIYDRKLSQSTIYKLDSSGIRKDFFIAGAQEAITTSAIKDKNYVIVIDEINRGNVSSIFGELITLIERDKRAGGEEELEVTLPYSKEPFKVPDNVYIIGTMNTADRSIEALDTALRRRFSFREMQSKPDVLIKESTSKGKIGNIDLVKLLTTVNQRIEKLIDKDHKIGHAYFMEDTTEDSLRNTFNNKVLPLLQEYFFGDFGKIGLVLGNSFVEKVNDNFEFAKFDGYDSSVSTDLKERPIYKIADKSKWNFQSIYE